MASGSMQVTTFKPAQQTVTLGVQRGQEGRVGRIGRPDRREFGAFREIRPYSKFDYGTPSRGQAASPSDGIGGAMRHKSSGEMRLTAGPT